MIKLKTGQCGVCAHFGEHHSETPELHRIRVAREAPELFFEECGHPQLEKLHLRVTAVSGCDGFVSATIWPPSQKSPPSMQP